MIILYEDKNMIIAVKEAGIDAQNSRGFNPDMLSLLKNYLNDKKESLYITPINRLDKPVSGIMVFAKNKQSAGKLSEIFRNHKIKKKYLAIVSGKVLKTEDELIDYLIKDEKSKKAIVVLKENKKAKKAILNYKFLDSKIICGKETSLLEIELLTGRYHQIRVQLANQNMPIFCDRKYNDNQENMLSNIALASTHLSFYYNEQLIEVSYKPKGEIWDIYDINKI